MKPQQLLDLRELLGSWDKVAATVLNADQNITFSTAVVTLGDDDLKARAMNLVMSGLKGKAYLRRMQALHNENVVRRQDKYTKLMKNFSLLGRELSDAVLKPQVSKRTKRRLKRLHTV